MNRVEDMTNEELEIWIKEEAKVGKANADMARRELEQRGKK